ncbi:GrpB family protein [Oceanobacillus salinisoli]|uniref:GrpB family protein n=1 Tax=Oceanobacillus salinisoli TaxID=2678611 RepID=UPI001E4743A8|nr:GrpB family protein [Oceanobacillus salinisoli]
MNLCGHARNHPEVLYEYYQLKVDLAKKFRFDKVSYTKNKAPFIHNVLKKAKREER